MRKATVFRLWAAIATALTGASPAAAGEIAVLMSARVDAYEEALRGFEGDLRGHRVVKTHHMNGADVDQGRKLLRSIVSRDKPDLVFAVGIWALQAALAEPSGVPVVYAMVLKQVLGI